MARSLGSTPAKALWSVTMRLAAPGAAAGAALVFLGVSNELTATLLLLSAGHAHAVHRILGADQ
ncbi:ABC transporter [Enterobacter asburiae]|uniref:ABC transporter n=1 Tax=Enterobacter asburiae TaxID=61645 RepID=A0A376F4A6_ENTAS|nr:ABC transporter [Enterobacter asburiae]